MVSWSVVGGRWLIDRLVGGRLVDGVKKTHSKYITVAMLFNLVIWFTLTLFI